MLDYKKISLTFSQRLAEFSREELLNWLVADRKRNDFLHQFTEGEKLISKYKPRNVVKLENSSEGFSNDNSQNFIVAA